MRCRCRCAAVALPAADDKDDYLSYSSRDHVRAVRVDLRRRVVGVFGIDLDAPDDAARRTGLLLLPNLKRSRCPIRLVGAEVGGADTNTEPHQRIPAIITDTVVPCCPNLTAVRLAGVCDQP